MRKKGRAGDYGEVETIVPGTVLTNWLDHLPTRIGIALIGRVHGPISRLRGFSRSSQRAPVVQVVAQGVEIGGKIDVHGRRHRRLEANAGGEAQQQRADGKNEA